MINDTLWKKINNSAKLRVVAEKNEIIDENNSNN